MNKFNPNRSGTPLQPTDGNSDSLGPTSEDVLWPWPITSSAWEGWWWGNSAEESATDSGIGTTEAAT